MGDESEGDGEPLFTTKRQRDPQSKSPLAENQQQEGNDNVAKDATGAETESSVSSDDEETDVDTKKKARVALYWSNKHEKEAAADAVWASTVFDIVVVRELAHTHDKTITYSGNPDSVVDLYPYQRAVAGSKCFMGNIAVHRKYLKKDVKVLLIPGQICRLFGNEEQLFCISSIIMSAQGSSR